MLVVVEESAGLFEACLYCLLGGLESRKEVWAVCEGGEEVAGEGEGQVNSQSHGRV